MRDCTLQLWCNTVDSGVWLEQCGQWQMEMDETSPFLQVNVLKKSKGYPITRDL